MSMSLGLVDDGGKSRDCGGIGRVSNWMPLGVEVWSETRDGVETERLTSMPLWVEDGSESRDWGGIGRLTSMPLGVDDDSGKSRIVVGCRIEVMSNGM